MKFSIILTVCISLTLTVKAQVNKSGSMNEQHTLHTYPLFAATGELKKEHPLARLIPLPYSLPDRIDFLFGYHQHDQKKNLGPVMFTQSAQLHMDNNTQSALPVLSQPSCEGTIELMKKRKIHQSLNP